MTKKVGCTFVPFTTLIYLQQLNICVHLYLLLPPQSPSVYCSYRRRALKHTLSQLSTSLNGASEPLYIYGDFNFRLDFSNVMKVSLHCFQLYIMCDDLYLFSYLSQLQYADLMLFTCFLAHHVIAKQ